MPGALIAIVIAISSLALTKYYPLAGLVPLLPVFALVTHYIIGSKRTRSELKNTILFSLYSMGPFLYLGIMVSAGHTSADLVDEISC